MKTTFSPALRLSIIFVFILSSFAAAPQSASAIPQSDTQQILDDLGGEPCFEGSAFTCVTIDVPLNHFDPADTRTIPVVFAVLPASGERKGMFVTATGGPGSSGVLLADFYSAGFDPSIFESFDGRLRMLSTATPKLILMLNKKAVKCCRLSTAGPLGCGATTKWHPW